MSERENNTSWGNGARPEGFMILGLNHTTAPVDLRERLSFPEEALGVALDGLIKTTVLDEGIILSTCNRVEIYGVGPEDASQSVRNFLASYHHIDLNRLDPHLYLYRSAEAIRHGFRVAASLDSMVIGETQITGQVKKAYMQALASQTSGAFLNRFMHRALFVAKKVRTETTIATRAVSVGSAAVELAKKIFGDLSQKRVALLGAGEMGEVVLNALKDESVENVEIANRTFERALQFEKEGKGTARCLDDIGSLLKESDVVVSSLKGEQPYITAPMMKAIMASRKQKPIFLIDLGVPRTIEPQVNGIDNVYLYNIDDLKHVVDVNRAERKADAVKAEEIIEKEASQFLESMLQEHPTISQLGRKFEKIRQNEITRTLRRLPHFTESDRQALEKCTAAIVSRILHDPILALRTEDLHERDWTPHHLLKKLFKLEEDE